MFDNIKRFFSKSDGQKEEPWPFDQPRNCAVITTTHILKAGHDITHVYHDLDDDGWQFHYAGVKDTSDSMIVALQEIVMHDETVLEVADIPPGWMAVRAHRGGPWKRSKNEN